MYPRVVKLLDDKNGTLFLAKWYKHHPDATAEYLSPEKIRSLHINYFPFKYRYVGDISFLSDFCALRNLVINKCNLSGDKIKCINEGFLVHCKDIDGKASDEKARSLVDGSGKEESNKTRTLEHIELTSCDIGPVGAQHLAHAFCANTSVKTLDLRGNPLGDEGAKALAKMLGGNGAESNGTVNTTLEHVQLSHCDIGPVGAQTLGTGFVCEHLNKNTGS